MKKMYKIILSIILIILVLCFCFSSCSPIIDDSDLEYIDLEIVNYPEKLIYIIGKDTKVSSKGLVTKYTLKSGEVMKYKYKDYDFNDEDIKNVDLTKEGVYSICINLTNGVKCEFPVQVVSQEWLKEQLQ